MKDVYVVYGRVYWNDAVIDDDGNYFNESNIYGVYESFENAFVKFKECVKEAHKFFSECVPMALNENLSEKVARANPFENYCSELDFSEINKENEFLIDDDFDEDELEDWEDNEEGGVEWFYEVSEDSAEWQMYPLNVDLMGFQCPILAGIYVKKETIKP